METHHNPSPIARGDYEEAVRLMNQGRPSVTVRDHLIGKGLDMRSATAVVKELMLKAVCDEAAMMRYGRPSPKEARGKSVERKVSERVAPEVPADVPTYGQSGRDPGVGDALRLLLGVLIFMLGIGLWIGNLSGRFPTFPFAGFVIMTAGGAIIGEACRRG
jgi:hypothetical protein